MEKEYRVGVLVWWYYRSTTNGRRQKLGGAIVKQVGDVVYRIQYYGAESVRTRRRVVHHNQIRLCTIPPADVEGRLEKDLQRRIRVWQRQIQLLLIIVGI